MKAFEGMVARYNATLPTILDGEGQELQLTSRGILYVTMKDDDGSDIVVSTGEDVSGGTDRGFIVYGISATNTAVPLKIDSQGRINVVVDGSVIDVDLTPGTEVDCATNDSGDGFLNVTQSWRTICSVALANGSNYALTSFDGSCDVNTVFQLCFRNQTGSSVVRTIVIPETIGTNQLIFPRAREFNVIDTSSYLELKAKCLRQNRTAIVAGGINAYITP